jgi:hypothetical protein
MDWEQAAAEARKQTQEFVADVQLRAQDAAETLSQSLELPDGVTLEFRTEDIIPWPD